MKRADKDLITKARGNQFRGVNNSQESHALSHAQRAELIKNRSEKARIEKHNTAIFNNAVANNTIEVLNLG